MEQLPENVAFSIGDVLELLKKEFPDITISKIRFLESQGVIKPQRTPTGFRKFYLDDIEKLRWVLKQQKENFLPLKVIKSRLAKGNHESQMALDLNYSETAPNHLPEVSTEDNQALPTVNKVTEFNERSRQWLANESKASRKFIDSLIEFKIINPKFVGSLETFTHNDLEVVRFCYKLSLRGIEPRHLKSLQLNTKRIVEMLCQVFHPLISQVSQEKREKLIQEIMDALGEIKGLFSSLVDSSYSEHNQG
jgi:DNA-binding transcriptional MerR regulator